MRGVVVAAIEIRWARACQLLSESHSHSQQSQSIQNRCLSGRGQLSHFWLIDCENNRFFVNKEFNIAQNPKVTAINSCIEVDLVGQVCSDSIGTRVYSGLGGQVDFIRGAALGFDGKGKPILAMPSSTKRGESKIVPTLKEGAGVVTTRAHAHYIVTEYGIAELFGRNYRQRAHALIQIAHPDHREGLEKAAFERLKCMPSAD